jgi:D-beta-D-heptose 7-phosphate kinase/D-beta-D-heptose 1-phosphate adenosyltransferase
MNRTRFQQILRSFVGKRVVVIGDLMTDEYLWGAATRISPESPVMVVEVERESSVPGGAANVVNNVLALGGLVSVAGVVGDDPAGAALRQALADEGADISAVVADGSRPTTRKTRVVAKHQQVLRIDRELTHPISPATERELLERAVAAMRGASAVVLSDYNKGVMTPGISRAAVAAARDMRLPLIANSKPANVRALAGATVVQLNRYEAQETLTAAYLGRPHPRFLRDEEWEDAGALLRQELDVETLLVTRGEKGLSFWRTDGSVTHVPAHPVEVFDEAGAGDTVISALTLSLAAGAPLEEAGFIANRAAAAVVQKVGVATVSVDELLASW